MAEEPKLVNAVLKIQGGARVMMLTPHGLVTGLGTMVTAALKSQDGKVELKIPVGMFPNLLKDGFPVFVGLVICSPELDVPQEPIAPVGLIGRKS